MLEEEKYNVRLEYIWYQKIRIQGMIEAWQKSQKPA